MNAAHLHIVLNHLPVSFSIVSLIILTVAHFTKNTPMKRLALWFLVLVAVTGIAAYFTGVAADAANFGPGSPYEERVTTHLVSAKVSWISGVVGGLIGAVLLIMTRRLHDMPSSLTVIAAIIMLALLFLFARTANLGGQIMHPEIRADGFSKMLSPD